MAAVVTTVTNAMTYLNALYELDSTAPVSGEEDFTVWLNLFNVAVNIWENEEGILWKDLFVKLSSAATGDKTTGAADVSYTLPSDFRFPASAYVWLGSNTNKVPFKVIDMKDLQLYENNSDNWCYFTETTLEFNPNIASGIQAGETISYNYYKYASALTTGTDTFEMSDPMFAVYYALSELKKEEGDTSALSIATQKLEGMKTKNSMPTWMQGASPDQDTVTGFGV